MHIASEVAALKKRWDRSSHLPLERLEEEYERDKNASSYKFFYFPGKANTTRCDLEYHGLRLVFLKAHGDQLNQVWDRNNNTTQNK